MFSRVGQDEREVLEYVPSSFKVARHVRPKLSCRACEAIVQAPMPTLPIKRGRPGPGLVSQVAVSKYADHTPLHRQASIYARDGVELDRATLADWVGQAVFLLTIYKLCALGRPASGTRMNPIRTLMVGRGGRHRPVRFSCNSPVFGNTVALETVYCYRRQIHWSAVLFACKKPPPCDLVSFFHHVEGINPCVRHVLGK